MFATNLICVISFHAQLDAQFPLHNEQRTTNNIYEPTNIPNDNLKFRNSDPTIFQSLVVSRLPLSSATAQY